MNDEAKTLGLKRSNFASAHGMYVEANVSCAFDIARLCFFIMKNDTFRQIVIQQYRECHSINFPGHVYKW